MNKNDEAAARLRACITEASGQPVFQYMPDNGAVLQAGDLRAVLDERDALLAQRADLDRMVVAGNEQAIRYLKERDDFLDRVHVVEHDLAALRERLRLALALIDECCVTEIYEERLRRPR